MGNKRFEIIKTIEEKRDSKVIVFITSDRRNLEMPISEDSVSILHEHILALNQEERSKLDLLIYSRGGDSDVPWSIASMFREYSQDGSFSVLIPYRAHSAATVIALGADEIVMSKKGELGPIDITISQGPYNPTEGDTLQRLPVSVEDVMGYFALLDKLGCARTGEKMKGFEMLTEKVHPIVLGTVSRLLEQTQLVALRLLGTRTNPFPEEKNREIVKRLSSEIYSHRHTINRTEAIKQLGMEQIVPAEDIDIDNELWNLYQEYRKYFSLQEPFNPEEYLLEKNLDENTWNNVKLACVESLNRFDVYKTNIRVKRLKRMPPNITINLNNFPSPVINVPEFPKGILPEQVPQIIDAIIKSTIQPLIAKAAQEAAVIFLKSLPIAGFETLTFGTGWKKER